MRISIRCKSAMVLKNKEGEIVVSMVDVDEDDVAGAYSMLQLEKSMVVEEIDQLVMPEKMEVENGN